MGSFKPPENEALAFFFEKMNEEGLTLLNGTVFDKNRTEEELEQSYNEFILNMEANVLQKARDGLSEQFSVEAYSYINEKYPVFRQQMLQALYTQSVRNGWDGRAAYIEQLIFWCSSVVALSLQADAELKEASTLEEIYEVEVDYSILDISNPDVTIEEALSIND